MKRTLPFCLLLLGASLASVIGLGQDAPTEAPAGFDTPTLVQNPGSQSKSNGIGEPPGDTYALDQTIYEQENDPTTGLGPVYNARACVDCHQNPVSGAASQFTELRVGHLDANGNFVNPTVPIDDGLSTITGRSIINDRAVVPQAQEQIPPTETIRALRAALNTLGDGFVEAIDDSTLQAIAQNQPNLSEGRIHGEAIEVPVLEAAGQNRVGRFGWKDQHSSVLSFVADAYLNEMGITNRLRPHDTTTIGKITPDPEDTPDNLGLAAIDHFAQFVRGTKVPPRDTVLAATADAQAGQALFESIGCSTCHVGTIVTALAGTVINGGAFAVPSALGNKIIHPYSDFLLHDIGTGDGIVQTPNLPETAKKLRTSALWGLRMKARFMHDLKSLSLENAVERHRGEAEQVQDRFNRLTSTEKTQVLTFLRSL
ncbi:MAG TPA: di-heme oxidoredictase family protein [Candidatus Eremiobacteraceae bacterium]|nr:di-heme oxidoredictase family protein [Candidatus Eremiobacteraceae bacterium]